MEKRLARLSEEALEKEIMEEFNLSEKEKLFERERQTHLQRAQLYAALLIIRELRKR